MLDLGANPVQVDHHRLKIGTLHRLVPVCSPCSTAVKPADRCLRAGHKLSLDTALSVVIACCKHRVPEPIRQADLRSRRALRQNGAAAHSEDGVAADAGAAKGPSPEGQRAALAPSTPDVPVAEVTAACPEQ